MKLVFGHYEELIQNGSDRGFPTLDAAMQTRVIDTLQATNFYDGDLKATRVIDDIVIDADFLDDITHFGSYSYWKKFLGIKISKKTVFTEINADATEGMTNAELISVIESLDIAADADVRKSAIDMLNGIYSDLQLTALTGDDPDQHA